MSMVRGLRLVNSIESGCISGACLETLLTDNARRSDWNSILTLPGQTCILIQSQPAMRTIANSCIALYDVFNFYNSCSIIDRSCSTCYLLSACSAPIIGGCGYYLCSIICNPASCNYFLTPSLNPYWSSFSCAAVSSSDSRSTTAASHTLSWNALSSWPAYTTCFLASAVYCSYTTIYCCVGTTAIPYGPFIYRVENYANSLPPPVANNIIVVPSCPCYTGYTGYASSGNPVACLWMTYYTSNANGDLACGFSSNGITTVAVRCAEFGCTNCGSGTGRQTIILCCALLSTSASGNTAMSFNTYLSGCVCCGSGLCSYMCVMFHNVNACGVSLPISGSYVCGLGGAAGTWYTGCGYPAVCGNTCGNVLTLCGGSCNGTPNYLGTGGGWGGSAITGALGAPIWAPGIGLADYHTICGASPATLFTLTPELSCLGVSCGTSRCGYYLTNYCPIGQQFSTPSCKNFYAFSYGHTSICGSGCYMWMNIPAVACYNPSTCCAVVCLFDHTTQPTCTLAGIIKSTAYAAGNCGNAFAAIAAGVGAGNYNQLALFMCCCGTPQYVIGVKDAWCALWIPSTWCSQGSNAYFSGSPISMCGSGSKTFNIGYSTTFTGYNSGINTGNCSICGTCGCGSVSQVKCVYPIPNSSNWLIVSTSHTNSDCGFLHRTSDMAATMCPVFQIWPYGNGFSGYVPTAFATNNNGVTIGWGKLYNCNVVYSLDCGCTWCSVTGASATAICTAVGSIGSAIKGGSFNPCTGSCGAFAIYGTYGVAHSYDGINWSSSLGCGCFFPSAQGCIYALQNGMFSILSCCSCASGATLCGCFFPSV